jgi:hypothetical protein
MPHCDPAPLHRCGLLGLLLWVPLGASISTAQLRSPGTPTSEWAQLPALAASVSMPAPDLAFYLAEDAANGPFPFRYGAVIETSIDAARSGQWDSASDGTQVWRIEIHSPGAYSLGFEFSKFDLPAGASLYVYDANQQHVYGAYTELNENPDQRFVIEPFPGAHAILECNLPAGSLARPALLVGGVIHDYRDVLSVLHGVPLRASAGGADGSCLSDINCVTGADWQDAKRAVLRTVSSGALCSAALINNTNNDGTPYVLTANHCGQSSDTVFLFNYETQGCGSGSAPSNQSLSGCTVLTNNATYDGRLLRINAAVPSSYQPYYAGWSRSGHGFNKGVSIGHPSGGPKKISIDNNGCGAGVGVWTASWDVGMLEGGSSGGPLFDEEQHIRGQAWWVTSFNCLLQAAGFGRFDKFWDSNGIGQWLAPNTTAPVALDAYDPFGVPSALPNITSIAPSAIATFAPGIVTLTGLQFGGASSVQVGGTVLTPPLGFTLVTPNQIQFQAPAAVALGTLDVAVTTPAGTSSPVQLLYKQTLPPVLSVPSTASIGTALPYTYGGGANDVAVLVYAGANVTFPLLGVDVLVGALSLKAQVLSPLGFGSHAPSVPASALGLTIYSQLIDIDETNGAVRGATTPFASTFTP